MSYVLDALKKADAERERGAVPGLHAQSISGPMKEASGERSLPAWVWLLAGTASLLLLALLWLVLVRDRAPAKPPLPVTASQAPGTLQAPASQVAQVPRQEVHSAERSATTTPRSEPEQPPSRPIASVQAKSETTERPAAPPPAEPRKRELPTPVVAERTNRAPPPANAAAEQKSAASNAEERIFALKDLPDDVRRALPPLNVGGSIYSDNPAGRFVIINGQVFHENDKLAPDLTLEQIRLKLAVLRYKDLRFRIMF